MHSTIFLLIKYQRFCKCIQQWPKFKFDPALTVGYISNMLVIRCVPVAKPWKRTDARGSGCMHYKRIISKMCTY